MRKSARRPSSAVAAGSRHRFKILASTEKAHNVKESRSKPFAWRARSRSGRRAKKATTFEVEMASTDAGARTTRRTERRRYMSVLRRIDDFSTSRCGGRTRRERRARKVIKLDDAVATVVTALKERGMTAPI
jgi:ParB family chromosome partitioning protein